MEVTVIRLGVGNTASVMFALERLGAKPVLTRDPHLVRDASRIILPGVGAAFAAMRLVEQAGLTDILRRFRRPLLGICLGQQLLYDRSEEGDAAGLGVIPGTVTALRATPQRPAPHMGWSALSIVNENPIFEGIHSGAYAYFVHSYACPADASAIATADYGGVFAAAVARGSAYGCQFHPERSGAVGARVLSNFLALPC